MASTLASEEDEGTNIDKARSTMVMKVFAKYSSLNEQIEKTRNEMKKAKMERESVHEEIQQVRQDRIAWAAETEEARQECVNLATKLQEAKEELCEIEHKICRAQVDKTKAEAELEGVKTFIKNHRQSVVAASEEFRATCQQLQAQASEQLSQQALAVVLPASYWQEEIPVVDPNDFSTCCNNLAYPSDLNAEQDEMDVISWHGLERDKQLRKLFKSYKKKGKQHEKASKRLQDTEEKHAAVEEIAKGQRTRKEQLQKQVERLELENCDLERQILALGGSIIPTLMDTDPLGKDRGNHAGDGSQQQIGATVITSPKANRKDCSHHRLRKKSKTECKDKGSRLTQKAIQNPYDRTLRKRSSLPINRPLNDNCNSQSTTGKKSSIKPVPSFVVTPSNTSHATSDEEQHPHLGGSIHVDPKFIPNIDITKIGGLPCHPTELPKSQLENHSDANRRETYNNITDEPTQEFSKRSVALNRLSPSVDENSFHGMDTSRRAKASSFLEEEDDDEDLLAMPMMFSKTKNN